MAVKILISTDIEGVAGVFHPEQVRPGNGEYERARVWMSDEANAAALGAFEGGADEVIVNDSHGGFRNLLPDRFDARVRLVMGKPRMQGMLGGLDDRCDAVFLIGYHSRAQGRGILAHTINSFAFARVWLNGQELGEAGLYGAVAGEQGIPVALASGDDVFIEENRALFPGARWVCTKQASGRHAGMTSTPASACAAIRAQARLALADGVIPVQPLRLSVPVECRLQTQTTALADLFCMWPGTTRQDGVTLTFAAGTVSDAVRMLNGFSAMSAMLR